MNNLLEWIKTSDCRVAKIIREASKDYAKYVKRG